MFRGYNEQNIFGIMYFNFLFNYDFKCNINIDES